MSYESGLVCARNSRLRVARTNLTSNSDSTSNFGSYIQVLDKKKSPPSFLTRDFDFQHWFLCSKNKIQWVFDLKLDMWPMDTWYNTSRPASRAVRSRIRPNHSFNPYRTVACIQTEPKFVEVRHWVLIHSIRAKTYLFNTETKCKNQSMNISSHAWEILDRSWVNPKKQTLGQNTLKTPLLSFTEVCLTISRPYGKIFEFRLLQIVSVLAENILVCMKPIEM